MLIRFTPAAREDARVISGLRQRVWSTTYRGIYPDEVIDRFDFAGHEQKDLLRITDSETWVYVIRNGSEPIGYFVLQLRDGLYIQSLYVLREYQGRGIGSAAFALARERCAALGLPGFYCHCNAHNLPAQRFYAAMGGTVTARDTRHENRQEDQLRFDFSIE